MTDVDDLFDCFDEGGGADADAIIEAPVAVVDKGATNKNR